MCVATQEKGLQIEKRTLSDSD